MLLFRSNQALGSPLWQKELCHVGKAVLAVEGACSMLRLCGTVAEVNASELICCEVHGSGQLSELIGW